MIRRVLPIALVSLLGSCATPVPPSGGPVDQTPPSLISMYPPSNSVDFAGDVIRFEFSERVDRPSFARALSVVPEPAKPPQLHWNGRRLEMKFADRLPYGTTFVFTIDNSLRDEHGVALKEPIVRAVSTGSRIDSGVITGRLLDPRSGRPVANMDVVATRLDTTGQAGPTAGVYRTQTGPEGMFSLRFLPEVPFLVYGFEDRNRNRSLDPGERFAVPPRVQYLPSASDSLAKSDDWWVVNPDTSSPSVVTARAPSSRRIELRYSEPVLLDTLDPAVWAVRDTVSGDVRRASGLYLNPADNRRVVLLADSLSVSTYRVEQFGAVRDSTGNQAIKDAPPFDVAARADTMQLRFGRFDPAPDVEPIPLTIRDAPGFQLSQYVEREVLASIVSVVDSAGESLTFDPVTDDGVTWRLHLIPPIRAGETVVVRIDPEAVAADTLIAARFRRLSPGETGSLAGYVTSDDLVVVEVYSEDGRTSRLQTAHQTRGDYKVDDLEVGNYRLRLISDRDGDAMWDWGQLEPYERPERLIWYPDSARVRAGWETVLDTLRFDEPDEAGGLDQRLSTERR